MLSESGMEFAVGASGLSLFRLTLCYVNGVCVILHFSKASQPANTPSLGPFLFKILASKKNLSIKFFCSVSKHNKNIDFFFLSVSFHRLWVVWHRRRKQLLMQTSPQ